MITHRDRYKRPPSMASQLQKAGCGMMAMGCLIVLLVPLILLAGVVIVGLM